MSQVSPDNTDQIEVEVRLLQLEEKIVYIEFVIGELLKESDELDVLPAPFYRPGRRRRLTGTPLPHLAAHKRLLARQKVTLYCLSGSLAVLSALVFALPPSNPVRQLADATVTALVQQLPDPPPSFSFQSGVPMVRPTELRNAQPVSSTESQPTPIQLALSQGSQPATPSPSPSPSPSPPAVVPPSLPVMMDQTLVRPSPQAVAQVSPLPRSAPPVPASASPAPPAQQRQTSDPTPTPTAVPIATPAPSRSPTPPPTATPTPTASTTPSPPVSPSPPPPSPSDDVSPSPGS